jgi:hypothetical protein
MFFRTGYKREWPVYSETIARSGRLQTSETLTNTRVGHRKNLVVLTLTRLLAGFYLSVLAK